MVVVAYTRRVARTKITTTSPGRAAIDPFCLHLEGETGPFGTAAGLGEDVPLS